MALLIWLLLLLGVVSAKYWPPETRIIPPYPVEGNTTFINTAGGGPFDGTHASLINASAIEWWYMDASSNEGDQGIGVWFMTSNPAALGLTNVTSSNWFLFHSRFADGTAYDTFIPAGDVIIQTVGDGSSGLYTGTGSGWSGTPDMKYYSLSFDIASMNISGEVLITRTVPSRSAINLSTDLNANMMNIGALGWALPVPAGDATAYVKVGEKTISFDCGSGYHDHNWGNGLAGFENWYAIHAKLGPYTFTAIEALLSSSSSFGQTYLTEHSQTLIASLNASSVTVRPWGNGAQYPPTGYYPNPLGATIDIDAGQNGKFHFNLTSRTTSPRVALGKGLGKWFGSVTGGKVGGKTYTGPGMFEWLDLTI